MSDRSGIEWTDATWNVVIGCDKVSPGCDHCYAIRTAHRMQANPNPKVSGPYAGTEADGEWTGRVNLVHERLDLPLRWYTPRRIFVNAQSDLFHNDVPTEFIADVFATMSLAQRHTFQILTKRPGRMRHLLTAEHVPNSRYPALKCSFLDLVFDSVGRRFDPDWAEHWQSPEWPLPNVWLGVSAEDQKWADIRIPELLDTPAAVRFVSAEPLLGPIDLRRIRNRFDRSVREDSLSDLGVPGTTRIDWVIVGGESGPGARPMHPNWARSLRDQCAGAGVPFLFKQWGEWTPNTGHRYRDWANLDNPHEFVMRTGKKAAGRELDGRTWDEYPGGDR